MNSHVWLKRLVLKLVVGASLGLPVATANVVVPSSFDGDLRQIKPVPSWQPGEPIFVNSERRHGVIQSLKPPVNSSIKSDRLLVRQLAFKTNNKQPITAELNIDGMGFSGVHPADPSGDVGKSYFIQAINSPDGGQFSIYNKADGQVVVSNILMSSLHSSESDDCANGIGKAIVLYDEQAQRWLLSELSSQFNNKLCVLVSKTDDPVNGGWYGYEFAANEFPDYPKYSQMGGLYYATTNETEPTIYAFERSKMLAGFAFNSLTPVDVDGPTAAPEGSPGLFIRHRDDEIHNWDSNDGNNDYVELWTVQPDFSTPENTVLNGPINIAVSEFDSNFTCPGPGLGCLEQKGSDITLDSLHQVVMYKGQYRRFDEHESLVGNFTINGGNDIGAVRWFELRRVAGGDWSLFDEGSYNQADGNSRYMAASASDDSGNLMLAYMLTGPQFYPSLALNGRMAADNAGVLTFGEQLLVAGSGAIASDRFGEYAQMSVDPVDGCTMWFSSQYGSGEGLWSTRITRFKAPSCGDPEPGFTLNGTGLSQQVCVGSTAEPITIGAAAYQGFNGDIQLSSSNLPSGISLNFTPNSFKPGETSTALLAAAQNTAVGEYLLTIDGSSDETQARTLGVNIEVVGVIESLGLTSPANESSQVDLLPQFSWAGASGSEFVIEIATDIEFTQVVETAQVSGNSYQSLTELVKNTQYFWRVTASNSCGGFSSEVLSFTTVDDRATATRLYKGISSIGFTGEEDQSFYFYIEVPEGVSDLSFSLSADNGDADLYISKDQQPGSGVERQCTSEGSDSNEDCLLEGAVSGVYFAEVYAYEAFSDAVITAVYQGGASLFIIDQDSLMVDEDQPLTLVAENLNIIGGNSDNGYELQLLAGEHYSVDGNSITPEVDFFGELGVNVMVTEAEIFSDETVVAVTVNPVNDAPMITSTNNVTMFEDSSYSIGSSDINVTDVDNLYPQGFVLVAADGENYTVNGLTISPNANYHGALMVVVTVNDGQLDSNSEVLMVVVEPVNDAPEAADDSGYIVEAGGSITIDVLANDSDIDLNDTVMIESVASAGHGTVTISAGKLIYQANDGFSGVDEFEYTISDSGGALSSASVSVTVMAKPIEPIEPKTPITRNPGGGALSMILLLLLPLAAIRIFQTTRMNDYE
jgi:hypothetical protein